MTDVTNSQDNYSDVREKIMDFTWIIQQIMVV